MIKKDWISKGSDKPEKNNKLKQPIGQILQVTEACPQCQYESTELAKHGRCKHCGYCETC